MSAPKAVPLDQWSMPSTQRERGNWRIHQLYVRQEYDECLKVIDDVLKKCKGQSEYPLFVKALIQRRNGEIHQSLQLFQAATCLNPTSLPCIKQVGRSLYLLGKHVQALAVYDEALRLKGTDDDWEIHHSRGLCHLYLQQYPQTIACFEKANKIQKRDSTYLQLGKTYALQEKYQEAINVYLEALSYSPENVELMSTVGLMYLRMGNNNDAFSYLGKALTYDAKSFKSILGAGSIMQDHNDMEVALVKYRVAAVSNPNSAQLWNNIGMCFFGQGKLVAACSCLQRALYMNPFEWIITYNLGLVHMNGGQWASAFHYMSASINLKPDFPASYMYLGVILTKLNDFDNAKSAYERAISMEDDFLFELNYAISLYKENLRAPSEEHFKVCMKLYKALSIEEQQADQQVVAQIAGLSRALAGLTTSKSTLHIASTDSVEDPQPTNNSKNKNMNRQDFNNENQNNHSEKNNHHMASLGES